MGPSTTKITNNGLNWSKNVQNCVFSAHLDFLEQQDSVVGSLAYHFQEESDFVILNYFFGIGWRARYLTVILPIGPWKKSKKKQKQTTSISMG